MKIESENRFFSLICRKFGVLVENSSRPGLHRWGKDGRAGEKPWGGGGGGGRGVVMETSIFLSSSSCATHKNMPYKEDLSIGTYIVYTIRIHKKDWQQIKKNFQFLYCYKNLKKLGSRPEPESSLPKPSRARASDLAEPGSFPSLTGGGGGGGVRGVGENALGKIRSSNMQGRKREISPRFDQRRATHACIARQILGMDA